jgi:hypothetical protein
MYDFGMVTCMIWRMTAKSSGINIFLNYTYMRCKDIPHRKQLVCDYINHINYCGPGSSVGIATELRVGRSGDRIPVGARFSAPVQTSPVVHPASCKMGTGVFPGGKFRPGRDADHF